MSKIPYVEDSEVRMLYELSVIDLECARCREIIGVKDTNMNETIQTGAVLWTRSSRELEHSVSSYTQNKV